MLDRILKLIVILYCLLVLRYYFDTQSGLPLQGQAVVDAAVADCYHNPPLLSRIGVL